MYVQHGQIKEIGFNLLYSERPKLYGSECSRVNGPFRSVSEMLARCEKSVNDNYAPKQMLEKKY